MQYNLLQKPEFSMVRFQFDGPGEAVLVEPSVMVAKDSAITLKTQMQGGLFSAMKRKLLGGESIFQNTYTSTSPGQSLYIAPGPEGDVEVINVDGVTPIFLSSGAFLASAPTVTLDTKWGGSKGFFSGAGMFLLKAVGQGPLFFNAYGGIHKIDLAQYGGGYIVDTAHVVGWMGTMDYKVRPVGGLKSLFLSGEGLVCEFRGTGSLWISTRNPGSLAAFLNPFRPVQRRAPSGS
jgi:uncharacterized protein (TIGR00266 family)